MTYQHKILREQIQLLLDAGHSHRTIGEATGVSRHVIGTMVYQTRTINPKAFAAIMSLEIRPPWDTPGVILTDRMLVPGIGTIRRLRALARMGYPLPRIAEAIGVTEVYLRVLINANTSTMIRAETGRAVSKFYGSATMNIPRWRYSERTRKWAENKGWAGAGAWDDIDRDEHPDEAGNMIVLIDYVKDQPGLTKTDLDRKIRADLGMPVATFRELINKALDTGELKRIRNHRSVRVYATG